MSNNNNNNNNSNIGVIGVNGLVGQSIIDSINRLDLTHYNYYFYGTTEGHIIFNNIYHDIKKFNVHHLDKLHYVILATDNNISKEIYNYCMDLDVPITIIDNSSEFRLKDNIPLCIPEINSEQLNYLNYSYPATKLIANPNCVTTLMCMVLKPLMNLGNIHRIVASTYQAASGAGYKGLDELKIQTKQIVSGEDLTTNFWNRQYVYNVFSHNSLIDRETLFNEEELKLVNETKKILNINPKITATCIRVPTLRSHCISLNVEFDRALNENDIINELIQFPGVTVCNNLIDNQFPEPINTSGKTDVYVGRIRSDIGDKTCWNFFISGDQLLKGAGYNSVQILAKLLNKEF
jgi:aspartate-semialdehyde dehydrogenase